jgi:RHS repeat-associated protein
MNRAASTRGLWALVLCLVASACGSGDQGERLGQSQSKIGVGQDLVIRQMYGRFGMTGTYSRMFLELYNRGTTSASLANLSVQSPGNGESSGAFTSMAVLPAVSLAPGQSFLIATQAFDNSPELPIAPDLTVTYVPAATTTGTKVALVNSTTVLSCGGTVTCSADQLALIIDLVALGSGVGASPSEGTPAPLPTDTTSAQRKSNGTQDTNSNLDDFAFGTPQPRNMDSAQATVPGAPALDATTGTSPGSLSSFVYDPSNPNAGQTGVVAGTIDTTQAGWIVGYAKDGSGAANAGVTVTVVGQSQYGQATTRVDGRFDLVVNGGTTYTLRFHKSGYFDADRLLFVPWQRTVSVDDVLLVAPDSKANPLTASSAGYQVASANAVSDADGFRTAVMIVPPQTKFSIGGAPQSALTLRLTEYTVGPNGPKRMPAPLIGSPAYTYAVEVSADEAGGNGVTFTDSAGSPKDVYVYVEDFIGFGTIEGTPTIKSVPAGYYDRAKSAWIPSTSGRIIHLSVTAAGVGSVDIDSDGVVDDATKRATIGLVDAEVAALAQRYGDPNHVNPVAKTLWRVPINHMTPWDFNGPAIPPPCDPNGVCPTPGAHASSTPPGRCSGGAGAAGDDHFKSGSIIACDSQVLGESFNVAGTPYSLNYRSNRVPGYSAKRTVKIDLTGPQIHSKEVLIEVNVSIAGETHHRTFTPAPNLTWNFQWDGLDPAGRQVVGTAWATIDVTSYYRSAYVAVGVFGQNPSPLANTFITNRAYWSMKQVLQVPLVGRLPEGGWSFGGWTLDRQHFLDIPNSTLYLGSGESKPVGSLLASITRVMGDGTGNGFAADGTSATGTGTGLGSSPGEGGVAVNSKGELIIADGDRHVIRRIDKLGNITTIAGSRTAGSCSSNGPVDARDSATDATTARFTMPAFIAVGPDDSVYVTDYYEETVRKLTPLTTGKYASSTIGGGRFNCVTPGFVGDGGSATSAQFSNPGAIAVGSDGSVYVADRGNFRIRRIDPFGIINTVAGANGQSPSTADDGKQATTVAIGAVAGLAAGTDGAIYFTFGHFLGKVDRNGILHYLSAPFTLTNQIVDGVQMSTQALGLGAGGLAARPDGSIVFYDNDSERIYALPHNARGFVRSVDPLGVVTSISANADLPTQPPPPPTGVARQSGPYQVQQLAAAPNGDIFAYSNPAIYRIQPPTVSYTSACADLTVKYLIPSGDEGFCFDDTGRHKRTIDLKTGQSRYVFGYTGGVLTSITGPGGLKTDIKPVGTTYEITAPPPVGSPSPGVQKTTVTLTNGFTTSIGDAVGTITLVPLGNGQLQRLTDAEGNFFSFSYDTDGYLTRDTSPLGTQTLARSAIAGGRRVTHTTPVGTVVTKFDTTTDATGLLTHTTTFPDLTTEVQTSNPNGTETTIAADGTTTTKVLSTDPVFGTQAMFSGTQTVALPSGLTLTTGRTVSNPSSGPSNPSGGPEVTTVIYDGSVAPPVTGTISRAYSSTGQTIVITSPEGRTRTTKLDGVGYLTQTQVGSLTPVLYDFSGGGRLNVWHQGPDRVARYTYITAAAEPDAGYLWLVQDGLSNITLTRHDVRGRLTSSDEAHGSTVAAQTLFTWYNHDVLKSLKTPELYSHQFTYDPVKELKQYLPPSVTGVNAPATNYTYTTDRGLWTEQPSGVAAMVRTYIPSTGQLDNIALPGTSLASLAGTIKYDYFPTTNIATGAAAGHVSKITGPSSGNSVQYTYDGFLRTSQSWAGDVAGQVSWTYNNRFWPSKETVLAGTSFDRFLGYDKDGLLVCNSPTTSTCNPAGSDTLTIAHSAIHGKVTGITAGAGSVLETWAYSDTLAERNLADPNLGTAYGELREQSARVSGTWVSDIIYDAPGTGVSERRDVLGRIRFKTEGFRDATAPHAVTTNKWEYRYDERGQLKTILINGFLIFDALYDKDGNIKQYSLSSGGPVTTCPAADAQDRIPGCGGLVLNYYDNGEVKTKLNAAGTWTYHYDALGRLRVVQKPDSTLIEYVLDGEGRRIAKKVGGAIQRRWLYRDGLSPVAELDGANPPNLIARYVYGSRKNIPDLVIRGGTTYRLISDQLGSPRYAVNVANKDDVPYEVLYGPFGAAQVVGGLAPTTISWIPFGFAGGLYDSDTGLVHFGARDYDPEIGRWISKDPIRFDGGQANIYVYVGNDPVNRMDPEGKWYEPACKVAVMAGCSQGCQDAKTWPAKKICSFLCSQAGQYMFCDWKDPGAPAPSDEGGACSGPDPEPQPDGPHCDPSIASCG